MKIGLFTDCYLPTKNGVVTAVRGLKAGLSAQGHDVIIVTVKTPDHDFNDDNVIGLPSLPFQRRTELRWSLPLARRVAPIFDQNGFDLIHTHTEFSLGWLAKTIAQQRGIPTVHTLHTFYEFFRHYIPGGRFASQKLIARTHRRFLKGHSAIICPSQKAYQYLANLGIANQYLYTIPNGLCTAQPTLTPILPPIFSDSQPDDFVLLYVGRLSAEKRSISLFKTLRPLLQKEAQYKLILVGDGSDRPALERMVRRSGLTDQVFFAGLVAWENVQGYYTLADTFVTASHSENHPMTLLEAITANLPIVAYEDDSLREVVKNGYNGHLVTSQADFRAALSQLRHHPDIKACYSGNSREMAKNFTCENYIQQTLGLYQEILKKRNSP